jgi:hypothetical protein
MPAYVRMYRNNFQPGRMCDDPALLHAGQVVTDDGTVIARASRVYNQWFWTGTDGISRLLEHPGFDKSGERDAVMTKQLIDILVAIAKGHNEIEGAQP